MTRPFNWPAGEPIVDKNGRPTPTFYRWMQSMVNIGGGQGNDKVDGIVTGSTAINPVIQGQGSLATILEAQTQNISSAAASQGGTSLMASASPVNVYGIESEPVTVTPSGGTAPYTHQWVYVSGSTGVSISNDSVASPVFGIIANAEEVSAVWKDTITDSLGATFDVSVSVSLFNLRGKLE